MVDCFFVFFQVHESDNELVNEKKMVITKLMKLDYQFSSIQGKNSNFGTTE